MKSNKINYFIVGTFVIAMIVGLVGAVAMLTGYSGSTDTYYAVYRNITGVKFGTQVMYEGYPIGQVTEVTPTPDDQGMKFRVDLEVIEGWRIPADSQAQIAAPGLLAAVTISIKAGESTAAALAINLVLVALFAVQHSIMARQASPKPCALHLKASNSTRWKRRRHF